MTAKKGVRRLLPFCLFTCLLFSCTTDSYEKGQGKYSLMQADLCELTVNGQKQGTSFVTDDGDTYQLLSPYTGTWITTADTVYRTIIYYNKVETGQATPLSVGLVTTLKPLEHWRYKELPTDPVGLESTWLAANGKYLNLGLLVKTARVDDEEPPHSVGLAQDTVYQHDDRRTACYRLLHNQNDIPQYYTNRRYVSILLPQPRPDTIRLQVHTYDGLKERIFIP